MNGESRPRWLKKGEILLDTGIIISSPNLTSIFLDKPLVFFSTNANQSLDSDIRFFIPENDMAELNIKLEQSTYVKGNEKNGNLRTVIEADMTKWRKNSNLHLGLTVHNSEGGWSSWPPHEFEVEALSHPHPPIFKEWFAYITKPQYGWGIQVKQGHTFDRFFPDYSLKCNFVKDRQIEQIPLGSHPIVSAPGYKMAYIWFYYSYYEKFK